MPNTFQERDSDDADDCDWHSLLEHGAFNLQPNPSALTVGYPPAPSEWACYEYFKDFYSNGVLAVDLPWHELFAAHDNDGTQAFDNPQLMPLDQGHIAHNPSPQVVHETCGSAAGPGATSQAFLPTRYVDGFTSEDDGEYELDLSVSASRPPVPDDVSKEIDVYPLTPPETPMPIPPDMKEACFGKRASTPFCMPSRFQDQFNSERHGEYELGTSVAAVHLQLPNIPLPADSPTVPEYPERKQSAQPTRTRKSKATLRLSARASAPPKSTSLKVRVDPLLLQFRYELQVLLTAELVRAPAIGAAYKATRIVYADDPRCTNRENARAAHLRTYRGVCRLVSPTDANVPPCGSGATNVTKHRETSHPVYEIDVVTGKPCWVYNLGTVRGKVLHPSEKKLQMMSKDEAVDIVEEQRIELKGWILEDMGV